MLNPERSNENTNGPSFLLHVLVSNTMLIVSRMNKSMSNHGKKKVDAIFNVNCAPNKKDKSKKYMRSKNYLKKSIIWVVAELCSSSGWGEMWKKWLLLQFSKIQDQISRCYLWNGTASKRIELQISAWSQVSQNSKLFSFLS